MKFLKKGYAYASIFGLLLTASFSYSMLKTFVIAETISTVSSTASSSNTEAASKAAETATVTDTSYSDDNISVTLTEKTVNNTQVYIADVTVSSAEYLKTALANNTYGTNVTAKTSETAANNKAILAVNGDYYGANSTGYVIRNGQLLRSDSQDANQEDLVVYRDGSFEIIREGDITAHELLNKGAVQVLSFGPALIENSQVAVDSADEVGKAMASNPRTAIGIIDDKHYVLVVSDGRTDESKGLSLKELADFMKELKVTTAYNLDGGGSSTMYFNGQIINKPTTNGHNIEEREVSDIVYL